MSKLASMPPGVPAAGPAKPPAMPRRVLNRAVALWGLVGIIVAAFGLFLLGNARVSLWDRDEPRYAECSREMMQSGDWVVPRTLGAWRTQKPPFIYWCEGAAMKVLGDSPFSARLPSVIAITLLLILLAVTLYRVVGPARALATVFVLATCVLILYDAKQCLTDSVLLLWITIAQLCLFAVYRGHKSLAIVATFWVAQALAALTKGPMGLMVSLVTMIALAAMDYAGAYSLSPVLRGEGGGEGSIRGSSKLEARSSKEVRNSKFEIDSNFEIRDSSLSLTDPSPLPSPLSTGERGSHLVGSNVFARRGAAILKALFRGVPAAARTWWRDLRPLPGLAILALIIAPWIILIHHRAPGFLGQMFHVFGAHVAEGTEQHWGPPGWHLVAIWGTFLPWSLFLPVTLALAWRHRRLPAIRFALATVLGTWVLVELIQTKLPHYILPAFPALAFLTGDALVRFLRGQYRPLDHPGYRIAAIAFAVILLGLGGAPWLLALPKLALRPQPWLALILWSAAAAIVGIGVGSLLWTRRMRPAILAMGLGTMLLVAILYGFYLPNATFLQLPMQIADCLKREGATHLGDARMIQYKEDSVPYYQGGTLRREPDENFLKKNPDRATWPRWFVIGENAWKNAPPAAKAQLETVQTFYGLNYVGKIAGTNFVTVRVVRKKGDAGGR